MATLGGGFGAGARGGGLQGLSGAFDDLSKSAAAATAALPGAVAAMSAVGAAATDVADKVKALDAANKQADIDRANQKANKQDAIDQEKFHARAIEDTTQAIKSAAYNATVYDAAMQGSTASTKDGIAAWGTSAQIINFVLAPATKAATDALIEMMKAQNAYTDSLQKTLSIATGWSDYLANLLDAYNSGTSSILQYKLGLENFLHTLETQFSTATGKAKAALDEMIATVQKLINTAGAGPLPSTDTSYGGVLNKQFNKP